MVYEILMWIGGIGLAAQTLLGFAHVGGHDHGHGAHCGSEFHAGGAHAHGHFHLHIADQHHHHGGDGDGDGDGDGPNQSSTGLRMLGALSSILSPLTIFSLCLGAGASGLAAQSLGVRGSVLVAGVAVLGAVVFFGLLVKPLWRLIFAFASKPAATLSGAVAQEAQVASRFDADGRGIVTLTIDGQLVRLLAHLEPDSRTQARDIAPGERLLVTAVDTQKGTCTVMRL